jgi:predicted aconitase
MYLTDEEKDMLDGKMGETVKKCMKVLVAVGEIYGAEKMLRINNVHSSRSVIPCCGRRRA